jgi:hypothetical protein
MDRSTKDMSLTTVSGGFEVDGACYEWTVRHFAGGSNPRGMSARVRLHENNSKELVVDFAAEDPATTKQALIFQKRLQQCVRKAIEMGWNPESRGKPFHVDAEDCGQA